jgi:hypothetical protein
MSKILTSLVVLASVSSVCSAARSEDAAEPCAFDRGLQDFLQIFVEFPSNNIDSFVAKLSEGRNRPIVFKCNATLGTFQKQDPNGGVESS